jgi:hypothetical protein
VIGSEFGCVNATADDHSDTDSPAIRLAAPAEELHEASCFGQTFLCMHVSHGFASSSSANLMMMKRPLFAFAKKSWS